VPIPTLFFVAFASGVATAMASRRELRVSPRPALLSRGFAAYVLFATLVLVPVSVYFYVFHGDWSLLYLVDVRTVPSAVAMVGFVLEVGLGAVGFATGAALVRSQREPLAGAAAGAAVLAGILVAWMARDRLAVVGSYAQFSGGFGLVPFVSAPVLPGALLMGTLMLAGLGILVGRIVLGARRSG
jgi:hypothetical protein